MLNLAPRRPARDPRRAIRRLTFWSGLSLLLFFPALLGLPTPTARVDAADTTEPVTASIAAPVTAPTATPTPRPAGPRSVLGFESDGDSGLNLNISDNPISPGGTIQANINVRNNSTTTTYPNVTYTVSFGGVVVLDALNTPNEVCTQQNITGLLRVTCTFTLGPIGSGSSSLNYSVTARVISCAANPLSISGQLDPYQGAPAKPSGAAQTVPCQLGAAPPLGSVALKSYYKPNGARGDNFTLATDQGQRDAYNAGYSYNRTEAFALSSGGAGRSALQLYYNFGRGDNFATATTAGQTDATNANYGFVRTEAFVFTSEQPGTVRLRQFWSAARQDNYLTATQDGEAAALSTGYVFVRDEGWVYPLNERTTLRTYWNSARGDNLAAANEDTQRSAILAGYVFQRDEAYVFSSFQPNTTRLQLYYNFGREDNFTVASVQGLTDAANANYGLVRTEGYVYATSQNGATRALATYWSSARGDNFLVGTTTSQNAATGSGYSLIRAVECYAYQAGS